MSDEKLVRMANQMADFFRAYPEAEAVAGIGGHIAAFWTPRMRAALASCAARGDATLDPLVLRALEQAEPTDPAAGR